MLVWIDTRLGAKEGRVVPMLSPKLRACPSAYGTERRFESQRARGPVMALVLVGMVVTVGWWFDSLFWRKD